MQITPPSLSKGDTIAIIAPAKKIEREHVFYAKSFLEQHGFKVIISKHCLGEYNYFSGTREERIEDLQWAIDAPGVNAILCARGGYGCVQIVDHVQWKGLLKSPKWLIGYSDVTILHSRLNRLGIQSLHGTAPLNFKDNSEAALISLLEVITGSRTGYSIPSSNSNVYGESSGRLVGGNLSIIYSLLGTNDQMDYTNSILFIEDLAEHLYVIDRMFFAFKKAGILNLINGIIVGGMTNIKDTEVPFGKTVQEIICSTLEGRNIPIAFDFPAGHIDDNRALILGADVTLKVAKEETQLRYL